MKTDLEIQKDVMEQLRWEPALRAAEIGVAVRDGIVTLSGDVEKYAIKLAAEQAAKRVPGVRAVLQEMEVRLFDGKITDEDIARAILNAFHWHSEIPEESLKVKVQHGWVMLEGNVEWNYQKQAAETAIQYLSGIKGILNEIKVKPRVAASDVKQKIQEALKRIAIQEAECIDVETSGQTVVLRGVVHSWTERKEIENAPWAAPGVTLVDDKLIVAE